MTGIATVATAIWGQISEVVTTVTTTGNEMMLIGVTTGIIAFSIGAFKSLTGQRRRGRR